VTKSLQEEVTQLRIDVATLKAQLQAAKEALALTHEVSHTWLYVSAVIGRMDTGPGSYWSVVNSTRRSKIMNVVTHAVLQVIMFVLQYGNLASNIVPDKYKPIAAAVISLAQGSLALFNHYYTPAGTPIPPAAKA